VTPQLRDLAAGHRVRAAPLRGRGWLNTGGRELSLADLRGRFVLLDFWTSGCVNCHHVLDELRPLEERFRDVLVVVGVHSPKFTHEATPASVAAAVRRYGVGHPVLDDADMATWDAYSARAWPTLVLVDPEGFVVAHLSGEGHAHGLGRQLDMLVAEHEARGTLHRGDGPYVPPEPHESQASLLTFPSKALRIPPGRRAGSPAPGWLVADTAAHRLVLLGDDLATPQATVGDGARGHADGAAGSARFNEPLGLALLPADVAARVGYDVVVADSVSHALRGVRLADLTVVTVAGTGRQLRERGGGGPALVTDLSTPADVAWFGGRVVVAMSGIHQLWAFDPAPDPAAGTVAVLAGTSNEGVVDGTAAQAWFAQPTGLAVSADGGTLWVADPESSALRRVAADGPDGGLRVTTAVGQGLFDFGFVDGPAATALLQHPTGVAVLPDGSVALADTYNGAVRRYDPAADEVTTLADGLGEPTGVHVDPADGDGGPATLVVVESTAHRLVRVAVPAAAARHREPAMHSHRPVLDVAPGAVRLAVGFVPPPGQKLDDRFGDPTRLTVSASPPELLAAGAGTAPGLARDLRLAGEGGVLHVSVRAASCDGDPETGEVPEHAACHVYQQDWGVPIRLTPGAPAELTLDLRST
jgi:thiol-disulfide isomerase/thioredoxin/sugar lactone lactonase YvrE